MRVREGAGLFSRTRDFAREFAGRTQYEGPVSLLKQLAPDQTMVLPGDYTTATRLRD